MFSANCEKKNNVNATIMGMITLIICSTIALGLFKMAEKAIKDYDYGHISIQEFDTVHKESYNFK